MNMKKSPGEWLIKSFMWHRKFIWYPKKIKLGNREPRYVWLRTVYRRLVVENCYPHQVPLGLAYSRHILNRHHVLESADWEARERLVALMKNARVLFSSINGYAKHYDVSYLIGHENEAKLHWIYEEPNDVAIYFL